MSAQPVYIPAGASQSSNSDYSTDPEVQRIEAQLRDWENCPTTPPQQKKQIVDQLQSQLEGVEASLKNSASAHQSASGPAVDKSGPPKTSGNGMPGTLDVSA